MEELKEKFYMAVTKSITELMDNDKEIKILDCCCPKCSGKVELYRPKDKINYGICTCENCGKICEGRVY